MAANDLSKPLGTGRRPNRRLPDAAPILIGIVCAVLAIGALWTALIDDPLGGEPVAVVAIDRTPLHAAAKHQAKTSNPNIQPASAGPESAGTTEKASEPAGPLIIKVPANGASAGGSRVGGATAAGADPALSETSKYGKLPRIADDGRRPADIFAATSVAEAEDKRPKVAIMIGGLGISGKDTAEVMERLPRSVTLGFTPYADNLESWVARARENGHEVLLQVPMEPFDYPNNDPGPQTLLTSLPAPANLDRLNWVMSRAGGYFGLTNYMGTKFTASEEAVAPVLTEAARRGLVFLDNGASPQSVLSRLGPGLGASVARAELVIDAQPTAAQIDAALIRLEEQARKDGAAIGVASALPVTIGRLEQWAGQLTSKGIALVPVSAVVKRFNPS